jgi:hypothetical protein
VRSVGDADVAAFCAQRACLSRSASDLSQALSACTTLPPGADAHVSLAARLDGYTPRALHDEVTRRGSWTLYATAFQPIRMVPSHLLPALLACDEFRRTSRVGRRKRFRDLNALVEEWEPRIVEYLAERTETAGEIEAGVLREYGRAPVSKEVAQLLFALTGRGQMAIHPSPHPAEAFSFRVVPEAARVEAAPRDDWAFLSDLALHYFRTAGPATRDDFARFAQVSFGAARLTVEDLAGTLDEVDIEGQRQAHFMLEEDGALLRARRFPPSQRVALLSDGDPEAEATKRGLARLCDPALAYWLSPAAREERGGRQRVTRPVLVGGFVEGAWHFDRRVSRVVVEFIRPPSPEVFEDAEARAERLTSLLERDSPSIHPGFRMDPRGHRPL